ncbi:Inner membrane transport protein YdhC [Piscirickettsiaceae bacterium NZ-RLO1]|nr:Inner membrane transport protein YdhC [Piscirickettsiaceae bacterium NZ-RLO1]
MIGLACFQLVYGPISDIYGRKPTLLLGLFIYIIASIFCTFSHSLLILLIARFFQAIGACSGLVIGRCIVSDLYDKKGVVRIFSIVLPFVAMSPAIAPVFGGYLQSFFGWRAAFACTILFGILLFAIVFYKIEKTIIKKEKQFQKFNIKRVIFNNFKLICLPSFRSYTFVVGSVYCGWFSYLAVSSHIYASFNLSSSQVGYCYISQSLASVFGSFALKKILDKLINNKIVYIVFMINLIAILIMYFIGSINVLFFIMSITITAFCNGIFLPLFIGYAMGSAAEYKPQAVGSASGLIGFIQISGGALGTVVVSLLPFTVHFLALALMMYTIFSCFIIYNMEKSKTKRFKETLNS